MTNPPTTLDVPAFSEGLQKKIDRHWPKRKPLSLGRVDFASPLILAPMSSICKAPFRLLMEDLGAGGTVSELVSATGIIYQGLPTLEMLRIDPRERNVGLQLFGDDADHMAQAAIVAQEKGAKFIDINMGCPVKKVVTKGAGSAMLKEPRQLASFLQTVKKGLKIPLSIKIRTGWSTPNATETLQVAQDSGVEFVAIHGRTREQQYRGKADWDYMESLVPQFQVPLIGNGDLHSPRMVQERLGKTRFPALMIARGCLRNPFIFLEGLEPQQEGEDFFTGTDYWEVIARFSHYLHQNIDHDRKIQVQLKKIILWFAAGFPHCVKFRTSMFQLQTIGDILGMSQDYFLSLGTRQKALDTTEGFMEGGHG